MNKVFIIQTSTPLPLPPTTLFQVGKYYNKVGCKLVPTYALDATFYVSTIQSYYGYNGIMQSLYYTIISTNRQCICRVAGRCQGADTVAASRDLCAVLWHIIKALGTYLPWSVLCSYVLYQFTKVCSYGPTVLSWESGTSNVTKTRVDLCKV